jgi:carboxylate-amine ligase
MADEDFTIGVEEEFFIVDAATLELRPRAERVADAATKLLDEQIEMELHLAQIETATPVCHALDEVRAHLRRLRAAVAQAAVDNDSRILAAGTHPFSDWMGQQINPGERYSQLEDTYQRLAWEQLICGCHVHVCVTDPDLAVRVMTRSRPWLSVLRAMAANSPYWEGVDTGYASYRTEVFDRWPTTGMPPTLRSCDEYEDLVDELVATEVVEDATKIYWDIRPSTRYATLELRVTDVCATVDETVLLAGLARSLVRVSHAAELAGAPLTHIPDPVLAAARWRAARYGLDGALVCPVERRARPAAEVVGRLLAHLRDDLVQAGEWEWISAAWLRMAQVGSGAARQQQAFLEGGARGVVQGLVAATAEGTGVSVDGPVNAA